MTLVINGKEIAQNFRNNLKKEILELKNKHGSVPGLAVIQVGNTAASSVYVKAKTKNAKEVGIEVFDYHLGAEISQEGQVHSCAGRIYRYTPEDQEQK